MTEVDIVHVRNEDGTIPPPTIQRISGTILKHGIVAMPSDTIYGLHGLARSEEAIAAIDDAKGRPDSQPYLVLAASTDQLQSLNVETGDRTLAALARLWPGPLTAILPITEPLPVTRGRLTIAVRIPGSTWLHQLLSLTGPLASTSLNRSGDEHFDRLPERADLTEMNVDLGIDMGVCHGQA